ncbi:hypothetical protein [Burkholderia multivorans]|uniref:hypothetical protein n=1 Tax=Burkholderia multivorans TaxID=87883 RepID=UPI0020B1F859|nr:hypothetical protein [Burkholderia multivorans]
MPTEEFWEWRGNKVHLDRYLNPNAPAKIILHHGVGTNGRQLNLIVGKPMVDVVTEVRRRARDGHRDIRHDTHRDHVVGGYKSLDRLGGHVVDRFGIATRTGDAPSLSESLCVRHKLMAKEPLYATQTQGRSDD